LAKTLLYKHLAPKGYYKCKQTPGLWKHTTCPISFTLVLDDFDVKHTNKADVDNLIECLKENHDLTQDWEGDLYCGQTLDISMPGNIIKQLQKYKHDAPIRPQHCPYFPQPKQYGSKAQ
jgi:hypothetical protein